MKAIVKRELTAAFQNMTAAVFMALIIAVCGIYFMAYNLNSGYPYFSYTLGASQFVFLIAVPILTMRSMAEERKLKTDQLLLTSPVSLTAIILGKYLAMVIILALTCLILGLCPLIIASTGTAYLLNDAAALLAFFVCGCLFLAIGLLISSLTESQVIAAAGTFGLLLLQNLWSGLLGFLPTSAWGCFLGFLVLAALIAILIARNYAHSLYGVVFFAAAAGGLTALYVTNSSLFDNALTEALSLLSFTDFFSNFAYYSVFDLSGLIQAASIAMFFVFLSIQVLVRRRQTGGER